MLKRILSCAVAFSLATTPVTASEYFFRFKTEVSQGVPVEPEPEEYGVGNDIHAYYVAPVDYDFSKKIPVATKDVVSWRKDSGIWPAGISLNDTTGLMSGRTVSAGKQELLYHGYDIQGHRIARAALSFNVFQPVGAGRELDFYAHTGNYFFEEIPLPQNLNVYRWESVDVLPPGVSMLGNAIQGTPTTAGTYGVAWRGFDFMNREVAFVHGELLVQDGPVVDDVADQVVSKDKREKFNLTPVVQHSIGSLKFNLVAESPQPPGLEVDVATGRVTGVYPTYDTSAEYHYSVTDMADGTQQKSNTFKLTTLPAAADLSGMPNLIGTVLTPFTQPLSVPNLQLGAQFALKSGKWPDGITLNSATGLISGTPTKVEEQKDLVIGVSGPAMTPTETQPFQFVVKPEVISASLTAIAVRVNKPFSTARAIITKGDVAPLSFELAPSATLADGLVLDAATGVISSTGMAVAGSASTVLRMTNGDGQVSMPLVQSINVYNDLAVAYDVHEGKRLQSFAVTPTVPDQSIVGTAKYTLASGALPEWLNLDPSNGSLKGNPTDRSTAVQYPPFEIQLADDTGEVALSGPIVVKIAERDTLSASILNNEAERYIENQRLSFKAVNGYQETRFELVAGKLGIDPDSTLSITSDGYLVGTTKDPVGTVYSGLVVRVSDADDQGKNTAPFSMTVIEPRNLAPLAGSLDVSLTWAKGVPFSGLVLPSVSNGYGIPVYAFSGATPGVVLDPATHVVSGTAPESGIFEYSYTIDDDTNRTPAVGKVRLTILDAMTMSLAPVYQGSKGQSLTIKPTTSNGITPISYSFVGSLPSGLSYSDGAVSGIPEVEGTFGPFSFTAVDHAGTSVTKSFTIDIKPPLPFSVSWENVPFTVGQFGYIRPVTTGTIGTLTYVLLPGSVLPPGMQFATSGIWEAQFAGTPSEAGKFANISISVTDSGYDAGIADDRTITVTPEVRVVPVGAVTLASQTLKARAGATFTTPALVPTNAIAPFKFTAVGPAGLPYDLILNPATGTLTGRFDDAGSYGGIDVSVTDVLDRSSSASIILEIIPALTVSSSTALAFNQFSDVVSPVVIANEVGVVTYSLSETSPALPNGLRLDATTGEILGQPTVVGETSGYVIVAKDAGDGATDTTEPFSIKIVERKPLLLTAPVNLTVRKYDVVAARATTVDQIGAVTYSVVPALPQGITLNQATGAISGTADAVAAQAEYELTAVDSKGGTNGTSVKKFSITVENRLPLGMAVAETTEFKQYFAGSVAPAGENVIGTAKWSISPALPAWATFNASTGGISAMSEVKASPVVYTLTLEDDHDIITKSVTISVGDRLPLEITDSSVLVGLLDHDLELPLSVKNKRGEITWTLVSGTLPEGLSFNVAEGKFFGHPTKFGTFPGIVVSVTDEKNGLAQVTFTLNIKQDGSPINLIAGPPQKAHIGSALAGAAPTTENAIGSLGFAASGISLTGLVIDPLTGAISGTPNVTGTITAQVTVTDVTKRTASAAVVIEVLPPVSVQTPAQKLQVVFNKNPSAVEHASASNVAMPAVWKLKSGRLPTGLTIDPATGALAGLAKELGDFGPFTVEVIDSVGGPAGTAVSSPMSLHVEMNSDPISLTVADYTAYVGTQIRTSAPAYDNELGAVTFFSPDVAALGLTIDAQTGVISGVINQLTDTYINVSIKDSQTLRVTSKPVHLLVYPEVRVTYPTLMNATQATAFSQAASIGFNIGTITYTKGPGIWPDDILLNASTGALTAAEVTSEAKTFAGLTVVAKVVFNGGQTSSQPSNVFSIRINPIQATPVISNIAGNRMVFGTVDSSATAFTPTVKDSAKGKPWNYGGTVYTLNHNLAADTGLTFSSLTGTISGTPTKAVIYRDLTITVTSSLGDKATTAPFWFGVAPKGPIVATVPQKDVYRWRVGNAVTTVSPLFDNWIGNPKFTLGIQTVISFDQNTGVLSSNSLPNASNTAVPVTLTDEFGRTGTFTYQIEVLTPLSISVGSRAVVAPGSTLAEFNIPTATKIYGTAVYSATGLPSWATINPVTGGITASPPASENGKTFTIAVSVTDDYDSEKKTGSTILAIEQIGYYRIIFDTWVVHASLPNCIGLAELEVMSGSEDISQTSTVTPNVTDAGYPSNALTDKGLEIARSWFSSVAGSRYIDIKPYLGKPVTSMKLVYRTDTFRSCNPLTWRVQTSVDKLVWTPAWSDGYPTAAGTYVTKQK